MRKKKICFNVVICIAVCLCVSLMFIYHYNINQDYTIETEIHLYDTDGVEVVSLNTQNNDICFCGDFVFKSSKDVKGSLMLLKNFEPCQFSLNDSDYLEKHEIEIPSSDDYISSRNNYIRVNDLDLNKNDMCLILFVDDLIISKRFQIQNTASELKNNIENSDYFSISQDLNTVSKYIRSEYENEDTPESLIFLEDAIKDKKICCAIDINEYFEDSRFEEDFKNRSEKEEIQYAIVPISYNKKIDFYKPLFLKTSSDVFGFEIQLSCYDFTESVGIRFLVFPFANEYNDKFLYTYKAFLWSRPIITHTIFKEEK